MPTLGYALVAIFQKQTGGKLCLEVMKISLPSRRLPKEEMNWAMAHDHHPSERYMEDDDDIRRIKKTEILVHVFFENVTYALFTRGIDILHAILTNCHNGGWLSVEHIS